MKRKVFILGIVFGLVHGSILAQERGLIGSQYPAYQKMTEFGMINNEDHQRTICEYATLYKVNPLAIATILWRQGEFQDQAELVMSNMAKRRALNKSEYFKIINLYKHTKKTDIELESHGQMCPKRNSFNGAIFNSIGAAEIKIYIAMRMVEMDWFHDAQQYINAEGVPDPLSIVEALSSFEGSIEFVAAELYWMKTVYSSIAKIDDVTQNLGMVWQLHKAGNFKALAMRRRTRELSGNPMPKANPEGVLPNQIRETLSCASFATNN